MRKTRTRSSSDRFGEHGRDVARRPVAQHVAEPAEIALADDRGNLVGRPHRVAHHLQRGIAVGTVQFVFHMDQRRAHHVVVVHAWTDGSDDIEPEPVDVFEVFGTERGRMRAEVIGGRAAARMMDDQADVDGRRLARALPGFAEQPRLVVGRQRFGFADVNLGRLEAQGGLDDRVEDVDARHDHQPDRAPFAFRRGDHGRQQGRSSSVACGSCDGSSGTSTPTSRTVIATTSRSPASRIAPTRWARMCGRRTGTRKLPGRASTCRKSTTSAGSSWKSSTTARGPHGLAGHRALGHQQSGRDRGDTHQAGERRRIRGGEQAAGRNRQERRGADETKRPFPAADLEVERHTVGACSRYESRDSGRVPRV